MSFNCLSFSFQENDCVSNVWRSRKRISNCIFIHLVRMYCMLSYYYVRQDFVYYISYAVVVFVSKSNCSVLSFALVIRIEWIHLRWFMHSQQLFASFMKIIFNITDEHHGKLLPPFISLICMNGWRAGKWENIILPNQTNEIPFRYLCVLI